MVRELAASRVFTARIVAQAAGLKALQHRAMKPSAAQHGKNGCGPLTHHARVATLLRSRRRLLGEFDHVINAKDGDGGLGGESKGFDL